MKVSKNNLSTPLRQDIERIPSQQVLDSFTTSLTQLTQAVTTIPTPEKQAEWDNFILEGTKAHWYAECDTSEDTRNKDISLPRFKAEKGDHVTIRFRHANTTTNPMLSIDGSDPNDPFYSASFMIAVNQRGMLGGRWAAGESITFVYNGSSFDIIGGVNEATTTRFGIVRPDGDTLEIKPNGSLGVKGIIISNDDKQKWDAGSILKYNPLIVDGSSYDSYTTAGFYPISSGGSNSMLEVFNDGIGNVKQTVIAMDGPTKGQMLTRVRYSTAWSPWTKVLNQNDYDTLFQSVSDGKAAIANAITQRGVPTSATAEFATMADNITTKVGAYTKESKSYTFTFPAFSNGSSYTHTQTVPFSRRIVGFDISMEFRVTTSDGKILRFRYNVTTVGNPAYTVFGNHSLYYNELLVVNGPAGGVYPNAQIAMISIPFTFTNVSYAAQSITAVVTAWGV